jgi:hypothetical protein
VWSDLPSTTALNGTNNYFLYRTSSKSADIGSLMYFNAQGFSSTVQVTAPQLQLQEMIAIAYRPFCSAKQAIAKAPIEYNGSGSADSLNMSATDLPRDGTSGNLIMNSTVGVRSANSGT